MTQFKENTAFYYPEKDEDDSSQSPADQVTSKISKQEMQNNAIIDLTEGKISDINYLEEFMSEKKNVSSYYMDQTTSGRTLNVPKVLPPGILPNPSFNGAVTIGEKCEGPHCSIPVAPTSGFINGSNLKSANPPPGATFHFPSTYRLGNNSDVNPKIAKYVGTKKNFGPFNIEVRGNSEQYKYITDPDTGKKFNINSNKGQSILENYKNYN